MLRAGYPTVKDNYSRYASVKSVLVAGDLDAKSDPLITIAIPTYNRVTYLLEAIGSAINQKAPTVDYEVIVVDNNPNDLEPESLQAILACGDHKLLYYKNQSNIGMCGNWNRCAELARGKWVSFLHDDDLLDEDFINNVARLLNGKKGIGAVVSRYLPFADRVEIDRWHSGLQGVIRSLIGRIDKHKLVRLSPQDSIILGNIYGAPTCGAAFRRDLFLESGGFDEGLAPSADWFFLHDFSSRYNVYKSNALLGYYRVADNESLTPETLTAFLLQDIDFRKKQAIESTLGWLLERCFRDERYFRTLSWIINFDKKGAVDFATMTKDLGFKERAIRRFLYRFLCRFYWYSKRFIAVFAG